MMASSDWSGQFVRMSGMSISTRSDVGLARCACGLVTGLATHRDAHHAPTDRLGKARAIYPTVTRDGGRA
jgi:hypothetical protein